MKPATLPLTALLIAAATFVAPPLRAADGVTTTIIIKNTSDQDWCISFPPGKNVDKAIVTWADSEPSGVSGQGRVAYAAGLEDGKLYTLLSKHTYAIKYRLATTPTDSKYIGSGHLLLSDGFADTGAEEFVFSIRNGPEDFSLKGKTGSTKKTTGVLTFNANSNDKPALPETERYPSITILKGAFEGGPVPAVPLSGNARPLPPVPTRKTP